MYKVTLMPTDFCQIEFYPRADCKNRAFFFFLPVIERKHSFLKEESETLGLKLRIV